MKGYLSSSDWLCWIRLTKMFGTTVFNMLPTNHIYFMFLQDLITANYRILICECPSVGHLVQHFGPTWNTVSQQLAYRHVIDFYELYKYSWSPQDVSCSICRWWPIMRKKVSLFPILWFKAKYLKMIFPSDSAVLCV